MMIGTVLSEVSVCRGIGGVKSSRFIQVKCGYGVMTALDPVGAGVGSRVLVTAGERAGMLSPEFPADTVVLGIVANCS